VHLELPVFAAHQVFKELVVQLALQALPAYKGRAAQVAQQAQVYLELQIKLRTLILQRQLPATTVSTGIIRTRAWVLVLHLRSKHCTLVAQY
jgi:hypothetical protein